MPVLQNVPSGVEENRFGRNVAPIGSNFGLLVTRPITSKDYEECRILANRFLGRVRTEPRIKGHCYTGRVREPFPLPRDTPRDTSLRFPTVPSLIVLPFFACSVHLRARHSTRPLIYDFVVSLPSNIPGVT